MNEVFIFMAIRSAQLADPANAIDVSTFLSQPAPGAQAAPATRVAANKLSKQAAKVQAKAVSVTPSIYSSPVSPSALNYATIYETIASQIEAVGFDPATTNSVVTKAIGKTALNAWVKTKNYLSDKSNAAIALVAAHLQPVATADGRIAVLASDIRVMNLIDALAAGDSINDSTTLASYTNAIIMTPPNTFNLPQLGPPYNPLVVPAGIADLQVVNQELLARV